MVVACPLKLLIKAIGSNASAKRKVNSSTLRKS